MTAMSKRKMAVYIVALAVFDVAMAALIFVLAGAL